jgi:putative transposase
MPRKARIDAPGALHHIIARGIARRKVFDDNADRDFFVDRLGSILSDTGTLCIAWALIPNHFHLLLKTGATPIATVLKRLLTGYAMYYNRTHKRSGHLFQNRPARHLLRLQASRAGINPFYARRIHTFWSWSVISI